MYPKYLILPFKQSADRRPIDPPPIIQLRVSYLNTPTHRSPTSPPASPTSDSNPTSRHDDAQTTDPTAPQYPQHFLQNPYYFMFASLAKPDDDTEIHWLKDGRTRCTTGSVVSSLYHLKDTENQNEDAGFFVFPDLSVRTEGSYRLKLSLYEVVESVVLDIDIVSLRSHSFISFTSQEQRVPL